MRVSDKDYIDKKPSMVKNLNELKYKFCPLTDCVHHVTGKNSSLAHGCNYMCDMILKGVSPSRRGCPPGPDCTKYERAKRKGNRVNLNQYFER